VTRELRNGTPESVSKRVPQLIRALEELPRAARGAVVAIGNFDGVHRGHRALVSELRRMASQIDAPSMIFTFDPHPMRLLRSAPWPLPLTTLDRRAYLLAQLGVDYTLAYPTSEALLSLDAIGFFEKVLVTELGVRGLVEGPNFRFGKDRNGDVSLLRSLCRDRGIEFHVVEAQRNADASWISSSAIRDALEQGSLETANRALLEPYRISGAVVHGAARGRTIGFPTANLEQIPVLIPAHGVYAGRVVDSSVQRESPVGLAVALNIGPNPTFGEDASKVEAHVLGYSGELYGEFLEIELVERIRDVRRFDSKQDLQHQLTEDLRKVELACARAANGIV